MVMAVNINGLSEKRDKVTVAPFMAFELSISITVPVIIPKFPVGLVESFWQKPFKENNSNTVAATILNVYCFSFNEVISNGARENTKKQNWCILWCKSIPAIQSYVIKIKQCKVLP